MAGAWNEGVSQKIVQNICSENSTDFSWPILSVRSSHKGGASRACPSCAHLLDPSLLTDNVSLSTADYSPSQEKNVGYARDRSVP